MVPEMSTVSADLTLYTSEDIEFADTGKVISAGRDRRRKEAGS
jgi:hypothetical protein